MPTEIEWKHRLVKDIIRDHKYDELLRDEGRDAVKKQLLDNHIPKFARVIFNRLTSSAD